jgi:hypothetical protein
VIEYEWDDAENENVRTHKAVHIVDCGAHGSSNDLQEHFAKVLGENQRKNQVLTALTKGINELIRDWQWSYDENRVLHVHPLNLITADEKALAQGTCDIVAGPAKVVIE